VFVIWCFVDPSRALPATLAVLVATCPCALSLATPAAIASATAALARRGVLVAHSDALEALGKANRVLWDKTGTLTRGLVRIEEIRPLAGLDGQACLALAAALERMSEHPIARAFLAEGTESQTATGVEVHTGLGLEGTVAGRRLRIGSLAFAAGLAPGVPPPEGLAGESWVGLGGTDGLLAAFRLTDPQRAEARSCVEQLRGLGLESEIVSGDEDRAVARVAERSGIPRYESRLPPEGKLARVKALQADGAIVAAVGDGINDAPLLRRADVSIAMGRGSALAQTSADLVLVRDSLDELPAAVKLARRTQRVVRQNLTWAVVYNLPALPLAAFGLVPPWLAAIGMAASSVAVVANAMRLARGSRARPHPGWTLRSPLGTP
jgi:Cu2+-exporting ATPase